MKKRLKAKIQFARFLQDAAEELTKQKTYSDKDSHELEDMMKKVCKPPFFFKIPQHN